MPDNSGIVDSGRINMWHPETRVSSVYAMALQQSQVFDVQPDEATKKKIERWRSLLMTTEKKTNIVTGDEEEITRESDLVRAYNEKMMAYLGAAMAYNNTRISALAGISRSVAVLGRAIRPKISPTRVTADAAPVTERTSRRCRVVSTPMGIGAPPRSILVN